MIAPARLERSEIERGRAVDVEQGEPVDVVLCDRTAAAKRREAAQLHRFAVALDFGGVDGGEDARFAVLVEIGRMYGLALAGGEAAKLPRAALLAVDAVATGRQSPSVVRVQMDDIAIARCVCGKSVHGSNLHCKLAHLGFCLGVQFGKKRAIEVQFAVVIVGQFGEGAAAKAFYKALPNAMLLCRLASAAQVTSQNGEKCCGFGDCFEFCKAFADKAFGCHFSGPFFDLARPRAVAFNGWRSGLPYSRLDCSKRLRGGSKRKLCLLHGGGALGGFRFGGDRRAFGHAVSLGQHHIGGRLCQRCGFDDRMIHCVWPFLTFERPCCRLGVSAYKAAQYSMSSPTAKIFRKLHGAAMLKTETRARKACAARLDSGRPALPVHTSPARCFFVDCSPARLISEDMGTNFSRCFGFGVWFRSGTMRNHIRNAYSVDLKVVFPWFRRFRQFGGGSMRGRGQARARVSRRVEKCGTSEPLPFIYIYQMFNGSECGSAWFRCGTVDCVPWLCPRSSNILAGAMCGGVQACAQLTADSSLNLGGGGKSFGVFGRSAGSSVRGESGGFLRFLPGRIEPVGRCELEGWPQSRRIAGIARPDRKPVRLRPGTPPCPHSRRHRSLSWSRRSDDRFGSAFRSNDTLGTNLAAGQAEPLWRVAKLEGSPTGRGERLRLNDAADAAMGRGGLPVCGGLSGQRVVGFARLEEGSACVN